MDSSLSNAAKANEAVSSTRIDSAVDVNSETEMSKIGVSLDYARDPSKHWYVMRISYNREQKVYEKLKKLGEDILVFFPTYMQKQTKNEKSTFREKPLIPNMLFVYSSQETIKSVMANNEHNILSYLHYYYNNHARCMKMKGSPLVVPTDVMDAFIRIVETGNEHIMVVDESECRFKIDDEVRVTQGTFKDVVGRVARIAQQQRVVVRIEGLCCIATAYVPSAFLEKA